MTDWTTCLVVRDRENTLWGRDPWTTDDPHQRRWIAVGSAGLGADGCYEDEIERRFGPIAPVLDTDGLPAVTTVGDLGNVHLGRRIKYEGPGGYGREGIYQGTTADYPERDRCNMHVGGGYEAGVPLDTPCEVLSLTEGADRPCPRCHGAGWHYYDEHHSKPCEVCCLHAVGVWQLLNHYGGRNGSWACRAGCGATWSTEDAYEAARTTPRSDADASRALGDSEGQDRPGESIVATAH